MAGVVAGVTPSGLPSQTQSANAHSYQIILTKAQGERLAKSCDQVAVELKTT